MFDELQTAFPQIETGNCLQTLSIDEFHIYDHEVDKRCYIQYDPEGIKHFTVRNPTKREIHFLAIDKCLFSDGDSIQRCDCAVLDEQVFCFIEIKTTSSMSQRKMLRKKAKDQLKAVIHHFSQLIDFSDKQIEAYVCLLSEAEFSSRPLNRASLVEETEEFSELGVRLFHDNIKIFL
ncbi:hypothetical protein [Spirosoma sp. KUDC1026]|uniref:hypothetical protein n=1 Tax=Spirosoma sp. KUDC1026 TaxID=2745947 RepID=UPI00159B900C|nr:hypothetical protein [Spirosoma sp. KUDC1026]QKZ13359.1 hypothetical protein HU175_12230 [Spirosoma sp. KUDC1026]